MMKCRQSSWECRYLLYTQQLFVGLTLFAALKHVMSMHRASIDANDDKIRFAAEFGRHSKRRHKMSLHQRFCTTSYFLMVTSSKHVLLSGTTEREKPMMHAINLLWRDDTWMATSGCGLRIASWTKEKKKPKADIHSGGIKSLTQWSPHVTNTTPFGIHVTLNRRGASGRKKYTARTLTRFRSLSRRSTSTCIDKILCIYIKK